MTRSTRRHLLGALAGGTGTLLAGCVGGSDPSDGGANGTDDDGADSPSEPDQLQSRFPDEEFPDGCPAYDGVDRVVCHDVVDPETVPAVLEPSTQTIGDEESIEFTLRNESDRELNSNFYNWRLHKYVDGAWYRVAPREYPEPLMTVGPGDSHTWTVGIDNEGLSDGESVPPTGGTDQFTLSGLGGGSYAFRARGWFAGESYEEAIAFASTFEFDGPPIAVTTTNSIESTEWDEDTLVATSTRGDPDNESSETGAFELRRVSDPDGAAQTLIAEQILRADQLRDVVALAYEYDADRVRLEEDNGMRPIFGSDSDGIYEFQGSYYEITTSVIEE